MIEIRIFFGIVLLAVALWLALRLAPPDLALAAWGALALLYGVYLSTRPTSRVATTVFKRTLICLLGGYAALSGAGLAIGDGRVNAPLAGLAMHTTTRPAIEADDLFRVVTTPKALKTALAEARRANQPAFVDVYADWCVECVQMKQTLLTDPKVVDALSGIAAIEFDMTDYNADQRDFMQQLDIFGPPTFLFYDAQGQRQRPARLVGRVEAETLIKRLHALNSATF